jgi:acetyltransferase
VVDSGVATSEEEAAAVADRIGYPVVMKALSDDIVHKVDVGGVRLNIGSAGEAREAFSGIMQSVAARQPQARVKGILVEKMIPPGEEVILGVKRDPSFGAVVMFGLGGIFVEIFRDVTFRVAPVSRSCAGSMVKEIKTAPLLQGARGRAARDVKSIETCILRLSQLALECPQIRELDINPMIVLEEGQGCFVADAKIML